MADTNEKNLDGVRLTAKNPRTLMQQNGEKLDRTIDKYGPVDGIVMNVNPAINELVSGNQRTVKFRNNPSAKIVILERHDEPTSTGTVASGYVDADGERWPYREVFWDKAMHIGGMALANQHAGENDNDMLAEHYHELLEIDEDALDSLFITEDEINSLQDGWVDHESVDEAGEDDKVGGDSSKIKKFSLEELKQELAKFEATGRYDGGFIAWLESKQ